MGGHNRKSIILYGVPYPSHAAAMEALDLEDYQELEMHKRRSDSGLHFIPSRNRPIVQANIKRKRLAKALIRHGFTNWMKDEDK